MIMASSLLLLAFLVFLQLVIQTCWVDGASYIIRPGSSSLLVAGGPGSTTNAWFSKSKRFAFGFYPQEGTTGYVVAIWLLGFEQVNNSMVVWTAYRDDPPVSRNATLLLTSEGILVLSCEHSGVVNRTFAGVDNISSAVMSDTGNFILYGNHTDYVAWQSFDHPTDTLLQGQSLFRGSELVSSVSKTNYSSGRWLIKMQEDGNLVMYPRNLLEDHLIAYWASGSYGQTYTSLYLETTGSLLIQGNLSDHHLYTTGSPFPGAIYFVTFGYKGMFQLFSYNLSSTNSPPNKIWEAPPEPCYVSNLCGSNSYCTMNDEQPDCACLPGSDFIDIDHKYSGCERNFTKETCISGKDNDTYYKMVPERQIVWDEDYYYEHNVNGEGEACSNSCLTDCDCDAVLLQGDYCRKYKYPIRCVMRPRYYVNSTGYVKTGTVSLYDQVNGMVKVQKVTSRKTWVLILVIGMGFSIYSCLSLFLSGFFIFKFRLLKYKRLLESRNLGLAEDLILRSYTYYELRKATNGFKQELGRGSFGTVYKGFFDKGKKPIAVKRLEKVVDEGEREFRSEMQVIGKTHHKNLVRLLGYCAEGNTQRLLVYEYMRNGTLSERLFNSERLPDWSERVQIALDVARGIVYLHEECETPIIHCDIKPANILMDDFWTAKISDFGMAKLMKPDQTKTFTIVRGTRGYLAPEWSKNTPISLKVDVFSYGIVLLEIICCRRNLDVQVSNPEEIVLSNWVYKCFQRGQLDLLVDDGEAKEALERLVKVGLWCIQDEPTLRPSMKCVLLMLEGITDIATPPCPTSN